MDWKKDLLKSGWKLNKEKLIFLFCSGLLLFIIALPTGNGEKEEKTAGQMQEIKTQEAGTAVSDGDSEYEKELEDRIRAILSQVEGVGEVDVMVVLKSSEEKVFHVDKTMSSSVTEESEPDGTQRLSRQQESAESTVIGGSGTDGGPIVEKELKPELSGIVISADGGGSTAVKAEISEAMEALFGLPAHKIKVLKRVKKGV